MGSSRFFIPESLHPCEAGTESLRIASRLKRGSERFFNHWYIEGFAETVNALEGLGSYTYKSKKLSLDLEKMGHSSRQSINC